MNPAFLTDTEKTAIIGFCSNTTAYETVRKFLLQSLYTDGTLKADEPAKNWAVKLVNDNEGEANNTLLGATLRAKVAALEFIEQSFNDMKAVQPDAPKREPTNPAL